MAVPARGLRIGLDRAWPQAVSEWHYDGQMQVESKETYLSGNNWLTKYGVGARGIDYMERSYNGGTAAVAFPIYDGHGNMIATIGRSASSPYYSASHPSGGPSEKV